MASVGTGDAGNRVGRVIKETPSFGMDVKNYFDNRKNEGNRIAKDLVARRLGGFDDLIQCAKNGEFDLVYIALALKGEGQISKLISELSDTNASEARLLRI